MMTLFTIIDQLLKQKIMKSIVHTNLNTRMILRNVKEDTLIKKNAITRPPNSV